MRLPLPETSVKPRHPQHFAEVIETATTEFLAQCLEPETLDLAVMPPFGSWVRAADAVSGNQIFAVVYHATTAPIDSVHRARALGLSLDELQDQQPQIFAMLQTEFRAAIVGFQASSPTSQSVDGHQSALNLAHTYHYLPPRPPQIHQAVYFCQASEVIQFTDRLDFLRTLLQITNAPIEGLIAATLREVYQLRKLDRNWLVQAGRYLSLLLKDDYDRLQMILSQVHL